MKSFAMVAVTATVALVPLGGGPSGAIAEREARAAETTLPEESIVAEWWTEKKDGRIRFVKHDDGTYMGVLTWGIRARKDQFNKDPKLRERPVIGIVLMWHLVYKDGEYEDGYVYNPEDGGTYRMKAWMASRDSLKVRGYLGISLFGQTQTWTRYQP